MNAHHRPDRHIADNPTRPTDDAQPTSDADPCMRLLTLPMIRRGYVPLGERTIQRYISAGLFPPADIAIGGKTRLWRRQTVLDWIEEQAAA